MTKTEPVTSKYGGRKLTNPQRCSLFNLAGDRFVDEKLRGKERAAKEAFVLGLIADAEAFPKDEAAILEKHGFMIVPSNIRLPQWIAIKSRTRSITRPDGKVIKRKGYDKVQMPRENLFQPAERWGNIETGKLNRHQSYEQAKRFSLINVANELPGMPKIPVGSDQWSNHSTSIQFGSNLEKHRDGGIPENVGMYVIGNNRKWITPKTIKSLIDWCIAAHIVDEAEQALRTAIKDVLKASVTFSDILEVWPEASELEGAFYGVPNTENPLVVINEDTKTMLCRNMKARGIEGSMACVA